MLSCWGAESPWNSFLYACTTENIDLTAQLDILSSNYFFFLTALFLLQESIYLWALIDERREASPSHSPVQKCFGAVWVMAVPSCSTATSSNRQRIWQFVKLIFEGMPNCSFALFAGRLAPPSTTQSSLNQWPSNDALSSWQELIVSYWFCQRGSVLYRKGYDVEGNLRVQFSLSSGLFEQDWESACRVGKWVGDVVDFLWPENCSLHFSLAFCLKKKKKKIFFSWQRFNVMIQNVHF